MSNGPVCHIPPESMPADPQVHDLPGILPPPTQDLGSIVAAIANIQQILKQLTGQKPPIVPKDNRGANNFTTKNDKPTQSRWSEEARVTENVRVFNPDDHTQFVDVEQINQLRMVDGVTKERWTWDRNRK